MIASFSLLAVALKTIPVGTGYAVWTGIGAAGTAIIGMAFLGESREVLRILCIVLIRGCSESEPARFAPRQIERHRQLGPIAHLFVGQGQKIK